MPTKPAAARSRKTKAEIQQELDTLLTDTAKEKETTHPKLAELAKTKETEIRQAVKDLTVDGILSDITALGSGINHTLSNLSNQLTQEMRNLATLREAVALESDELNRLHKIDISMTALDLLIEDYQQQKISLEKEITTQRESWQQERIEHQREQREHEDNLKKLRQRERDEFDYQKTLERKKEQDQYDQERRAIERKNRDQQETLEKDWKAREQALAEQEEELARLRKEAKEFPSRLQAEVDKAIAETRHTTEQENAQTLLLLKKDAEAEARIAQLRIKALEESLIQQAAQVTALQKQLDEAKQQVQDIAVKAIEGASGARALSHINQIAMEQAKMRGGQGG